MKLHFPLFSPEGDTPPAGGGGGGTPGGSTTLFGGADSSGSSQHQPGAGGAAQSWSWTKEDGALNEGWLDKLEGDLKGNASLRTIGSLPDLAKAYVHTKGMVGKKLEMPAPDGKPEDWANWRKVTGAPDKPEGYRGDAKSLRPENVAEDLWNVESESKFLGIAHKYGLPPAAVKEILGFYGESMIEGLKQGQAAEGATVEAERQTLVNSWGKDFDGNLLAAAQMARTVGLDPKTDPIFTNARAVEAFFQMSKLISGDKLIGGETPGLSGTISDRIKDITDPKSQSTIAREYRGEFGSARQEAAQKQYHQLLGAQNPQK